MRLHNILLFVLLGFSILIILWINFFEQYYIIVPLNIDSDNVNRLIETIAIAYSTSFVFYLLVVVLRQKRDEKWILPFIADYVYVTLNNCVFLCSFMRSTSGIKDIQTETSIYNRDLKIYPDNNELHEICKKINPNKAINHDIGLEGFSAIPHFFGIMINYAHRIDYFLKIILEKSRFMDTRLLRLLTDIQTHGYHQHMVSFHKSSVLTAKHRHDNLEVFEKSLQDYFEIFKNLA